MRDDATDRLQPGAFTAILDGHGEGEQPGVAQIGEVLEWKRGRAVMRSGAGGEGGGQLLGPCDEVRGGGALSKHRLASQDDEVEFLDPYSG